MKHHGVLDGVHAFEGFDAEALADVMRLFGGDWGRKALGELEHRALCGDGEAEAWLVKLGYKDKNDV